MEASVVPNGLTLGIIEFYLGLQADIFIFPARENRHQFSTEKKDLDTGEISDDRELKERYLQIWAILVDKEYTGQTLCFIFEIEAS